MGHEEQKFYVVELRGYIFVFLRTAQGSRGAPLTWARLAALVGRLTQAMFDPGTVRINTYVDDPLCAFYGDKTSRDRNCATIILVWAALGFSLSLAKAKRGSETTWTSAALKVEREPDDCIVVAQAKKALVADAHAMALEFLSCNVISQKKLRSFGGKVSHIGSLVFVLRPFAAEIWAAVCADESASGAPRGCVWTSQVRHTLCWLAAFFGDLHDSTLIRRFSAAAMFNKGLVLDMVLDASPWGLGGALYQDGVPIEFFASELGPDDVSILDIEIGSCTCQQTVEALAVLVAYRAWHKHLGDARCEWRVKSD